MPDLPNPTKPITEIYVWIAVHANGGEGILSADLPTPVGPRHMPLMSSDRDIAEGMGGVARAIEMASRAAGTWVTVEMRSFRLVTH
jgi:hypothetical protein